MRTVLNRGLNRDAESNLLLPLSRFATLSALPYSEKYRFSLRLDCGISIAYKQARP